MESGRAHEEEKRRRTREDEERAGARDSRTESDDDAREIGCERARVVALGQNVHQSALAGVSVRPCTVASLPLYVPLADW